MPAHRPSAGAAMSGLKYAQGSRSSGAIADLTPRHPAVVAILQRRSVAVRFLDTSRRQHRQAEPPGDALRPLLLRIQVRQPRQHHIAAPLTHLSALLLVSRASPRLPPPDRRLTKKHSSKIAYTL